MGQSDGGGQGAHPTPWSSLDLPSREAAPGRGARCPALAGGAIATAVLLGVTGPAGAATCTGAKSAHPRITHICALMLQTSASVLAYVPTVYCINPNQGNCQEQRRLMIDGGVVKPAGPDGYGAISGRLTAVFGIDNNDFSRSYVLNP